MDWIFNVSWFEDGGVIIEEVVDVGLLLKEMEWDVENCMVYLFGYIIGFWYKIFGLGFDVNSMFFFKNFFYFYYIVFDKLVLRVVFYVMKMC